MISCPFRLRSSDRYTLVAVVLSMSSRRCGVRCYWKKRIFGIPYLSIDIISKLHKIIIHTLDQIQKSIIIIIFIMCSFCSPNGESYASQMLLPSLRQGHALLIIPLRNCPSSFHYYKYKRERHPHHHPHPPHHHHSQN
jgi:hypothetical protein